MKLRAIAWLMTVICVIFYLIADEIILSVSNIPGWHIGLLQSLPDFAPEWLVPYSDQPCMSVVVLKTGRSGSTWLYNLLNKLPAARLVEELKIDSALSSGEAREWLWGKLRCHRGIRMEGFTSDLNGVTGPELRQLITAPVVADAKPTPELFVHFRRNLIKHTLAWLHGEEQQKYCGVAHKRVLPCQVPPAVRVDPCAFLCFGGLVTVGNERVFTRVMEATGSHLQADRATFYETLQADVAVGLGPYLDHPRFVEVVQHGLSQEQLLEALRADGLLDTRKLTPDDLRLAILNFEEIADIIENLQAPCLLPMLRDPLFAQDAESFTGIGKVQALNQFRQCVHVASTAFYHAVIDRDCTCSFDKDPDAGFIPPRDKPWPSVPESQQPRV
jgi:hypothetical protein